MIYDFRFTIYDYVRRQNNPKTFKSKNDILDCALRQSKIVNRKSTIVNRKIDILDCALRQSKIVNLKSKIQNLKSKIQNLKSKIQNPKSKIVIICLLCLLASCKSKRPDVSNIDLNVEIQRLDQDIFEMSADSLHSKYDIFFDYYTEGILNIGNYKDISFHEHLEMFKTDSIVQKAYTDVNKQYPDLKQLTDKLTAAFKYWRYYFPDKYIPKVYTYISGYNQSFILTDSVLAIGLDKYLGADYDFYNNLQFHKYLSRNMYPEKIIADYIVTMAGSEWSFNNRKNNDLISKMLFEGKILYAAKMILPDEPDFRIFGFTADQLRWCKNNEKTMWITLIENKLLFTTDYFMIRKLTEVAPYTTEFTAESPGKACNWIGYKIIAKYMKDNPQISLQNLMDNDDYRKIFEQARYKP